MNKQRVRESLQKFDFQGLFLDDLGWDSASSTLPISLNGHDFKLAAVAEKRRHCLLHLLTRFENDDRTHHASATD